MIHLYTIGGFHQEVMTIKSPQIPLFCLQKWIQLSDVSQVANFSRVSSHNFGKVHCSCKNFNISKISFVWGGHMLDDMAAPYKTNFEIFELQLLCQTYD